MRGKKNLWLVVLPIFPVILLIIGLICFQQSNCFRKGQIYPSKNFSFQSASVISREEMNQVKALASQNFFLVHRGSQYYVFSSEDGEYILKFFNMKNFNAKRLIDYVPRSWLSHKRLVRIGVKEKIRNRILESLKIAAEPLRMYTGIVHVHLFRSNWIQQKLQLIDDAGKKHEIVLDEVPFVIQKKAIMLKDQISNYLERGEEKQAVHAILSVLLQVKRLAEEGIIVPLSKIMGQCGFVGQTLVFVDFGEFQKDQNLKNSCDVLQEVFHASGEIELWVCRNFPMLLPELQFQLQSFLDF